MVDVCFRGEEVEVSVSWSCGVCYAVCGSLSVLFFVVVFVFFVVVVWIVFGGDCTLTPARIIVEEVEGESLIRMYPHELTNPVRGINYESLLLEPGDGAVTKASLLGRDVLDPSVPRHKYSFFPLDHAVLLCEKHNSLTGNVTFQDNLLNALLVRD